MLRSSSAFIVNLLLPFSGHTRMPTNELTRTQRTDTHTHTRRERKAYIHTQSAYIWRDANTSGQPFIEIYRETTNECEEKTVTHRVYKQIDKTNNKWCPWECHLLWAQLTSLPVTRIGCDQIGFVYLVENRHNVSPPHTHTPSNLFDINSRRLILTSSRLSFAFPLSLCLSIVYPFFIIVSVACCGHLKV